MHLTAMIVDRYLCTAQTPRSELQLVGVTALLVASKQLEFYPPTVQKLCYICDSVYKVREHSFLCLPPTMPPHCRDHES